MSSAMSSTAGLRSSRCSAEVGSRRSTGFATRSKERSAPFKLFDSAAGYEAVRREIGALRKIQHPHVVQVYWAAQTADGHWYLVTEYIDGRSLDEYVTGEQHLSDREAVDVALDILDALVAIHPDSVRLGKLDRKRRSGELSRRGVQRVAGACRRGDWCTAT